MPIGKCPQPRASRAAASSAGEASKPPSALALEPWPLCRLVVVVAARGADAVVVQVSGEGVQAGRGRLGRAQPVTWKDVVEGAPGLCALAQGWEDGGKRWREGERGLTFLFPIFSQPASSLVDIKPVVPQRVLDRGIGYWGLDVLQLLLDHRDRRDHLRCRQL